MADLSITRNSELMVAHIEALTEEGIEFLDGYMTSEMVVVDSGRIIVPESGLDAVLAAAKELALTTERTDQ